MRIWTYQESRKGKWSHLQNYQSSRAIHVDTGQGNHCGNSNQDINSDAVGASQRGFAVGAHLVLKRLFKLLIGIIFEVGWRAAVLVNVWLLEIVVAGGVGLTEVTVASFAESAQDLVVAFSDSSCQWHAVFDPAKLGLLVTPFDSVCRFLPERGRHAGWRVDTELVLVVLRTAGGDFSLVETGQQERFLLELRKIHWKVLRVKDGLDGFWN